ncbi:MAG: hypothetical protein IPM64_18015 [Phycisphaerales bacterium]|nr:hypothetical protein [Phycisphaerales bacterium]
MRRAIQVAICNVLLLCAAASAAEPAPPLAFSIWHIDGHTYEWQRDRQVEGLPLEPAIRVPDWHVLSGTSFLRVGSSLTLEQGAPVLETFDRQPLALRMNNITDAIDWAFPRIDPLTETNWPQSHLSIRRLADGTLDDTPFPSPFAGPAKWADVGLRMATSPWLSKLQTIIKAPTSIILRENNEGARLDFASLYIAGRVFIYRADINQRQFASLSTPRSDWRWENLQPITGSDWHVLSGDYGETLYVCRWKTDAELDQIDLRAKDWVGLLRTTPPPKAEPAFQQLIREQYRAFYAALQSNLSPAWRAVPFRTIGYANNQHGQNPSASLQTYMGYYRPASLCRPEHAAEIAARRTQWQRELADPEAWRELSIRHRGPTIFAAVQDGTGDFVDSESFSGFMMHYLWAMQSAGREARIVWWEGYLTPPTQPVAVSTVWQQTLTSLGRPDLNAMTVGDCEVAVMRKMDEIHRHPLLLRYYRDGATTVLASAQNTASVHRVYATLTTLPDSPRKLLAVYTPCSPAQAPELQAGEYRVPWARWTYRLTDPLEPLPPPVLTLEQRVERLERKVFGDGVN